MTRFEHDVKQAFIEVNFMEDGDSKMYDTFGKKEVDKRVPELNHGKKALWEHCLEGDRVLMVVQSVPMKYRITGAVTQAVTFFDTLSTCSVVRNQFAEEHKMFDEEIVITLTTVNGTSSWTRTATGRS